MTPLPLHEFHQSLNAAFTAVRGMELVAHYGDVPGEHAALHTAAGVIDLSARGRLCLLGADRQKFLNGQVTNDVARLRPGQGCYAALVSAKGKMHGDLNIFRLAEELLLDCEPGYHAAITQRLEQFIIADDVQIVDAAPHYGLLSVQGPRAAEIVAQLGMGVDLPGKSHDFATLKDATMGEIYLMNLPRLGSAGFDLFVPLASLGMVADKLVAAAKKSGGRACGWEALEIARIEAGLPRFGVDMDETTLPPEAGLEARAISYNKGCYIGQEVIARIRTYGQVAKSLHCLRLADNLATLPVKGDKLFKDGKEVGFITSAVNVPTSRANIALGYVRRECNAVGTELLLHNVSGDNTARIVPAPFSTQGEIPAR